MRIIRFVPYETAATTGLIKILEPNVYTPTAYNNPLALYKKNMPIWIEDQQQQGYHVAQLEEDYNTESKIEADIRALLRDRNL